jgi:hypothetical protein
MSRIDRQTQKRNIFIYLLCYNENGEIIKEEKDIFQTMNMKFNDAKATYMNVSHQERLGNIRAIDFTLTKHIPFMITIKNITRFNEDFDEFIKGFTHTQIEQSYPVIGDQGYHLDITIEKMKMQAGYYLQCFGILYQFPWRIIRPDIKTYLNNFYRQRVSGKIRNRLKESVEKKIWAFPAPLLIDKYYPFVFIKGITMSVKMKFGNTVSLFITCIMGKKENGEIDFLGYLKPRKVGLDYYNEIFNHLKNMGIQKISTIILSMMKPNILKDIQENAQKYFFNIDCQWCVTSFFNAIYRIMPNDIKLFDIEKILLAVSVKNAHAICNNLVRYWIENKYILKRVDGYLFFFSSFYHYSPEKRMVIGTANIIDYIRDIVVMIINDMDFYDKDQAIDYITIASRQIIKDGAKLIPIWDQIIKKVRPYNPSLSYAGENIEAEDIEFINEYFQEDDQDLKDLGILPENNEE